jgi:hypothetical protein
MRPFLLSGGSSRQQREYVEEVAKRNNWNLLDVDKENFEEELRKSTITSTLSGRLNLFYVTNIDALPPQKLEKLLKFAESSPHRFIFSARHLYKISKPLQQRTLIIRTGEVVQEVFFQVLTALMSEPDRNKVRQQLLNPDVNLPSLLRILEENAWKTDNPDVLTALEACNKLLYKVDDEYLASILAYLFPPVKVPISIGFSHRKLYKEQNSILESMRRKYRLNQKESLDLYDYLRQILPLNPNLGNSFAEELNLSDEERRFLKIEKSTPTLPPPSSPPESSNLEKWF